MRRLILIVLTVVLLATGAPRAMAASPALDDPTRWGLNFGSRVSTYQNRAQVARIFLAGLGGVTWANNAGIQRATRVGIKTFVVSWTDQNLDHVKAFLASVPNDVTVYACFNHEPENDHGNPGSASYKQWSAQWKHQWTIQSPLIRAQGFIPTQILMAWTLFPGSNRNIADWTAPKGTIDVFAFDGYVNRFDPVEMVNKMLAAANAAGIRYTGIAETGSQVSDPLRVARIKALKAAMLSAGNRFKWGIYWDAQEPGFNGILDGATANAWLPAS